MLFFLANIIPGGTTIVTRSSVRVTISSAMFFLAWKKKTRNNSSQKNEVRLSEKWRENFKKQFLHDHTYNQQNERINHPDHGYGGQRRNVPESLILKFKVHSSKEDYAPNEFSLGRHETWTANKKVNVIQRIHALISNSVHFLCFVGLCCSLSNTNKRFQIKFL